MKSGMANPDPSCNKECRFSCSPSLTTAMYYHPIYDKNGVNVNPDMNISSREVSCLVCHRSWYETSRNGETTFKLIERNS